MVSHFAQAVARWQAEAGQTQRALAVLLGCHESHLSLLKSGDRRPTAEFMAQAIARAPEPWKTELRNARQADQDAIDAALAVVA